MRIFNGNRTTSRMTERNMTSARTFNNGPLFCRYAVVQK